jgi:hypothetical protein
MEVMETFQVLRRRRLLSSVLLLLTVAGTAGAAVKLPWTYQSVAQTVLLNSNTASKASGGNPYLAFDPSLTQTANVLCLELMDPRTAHALASEGYSAGYQVVVNSVTGGPVIQITVTGSNAGTVEHTLSGVTDAVSTKLQGLQSGIAPQNRITSTVLSVQPTATRSLSKKAKPLVAVLGVGLALTFAIPQLVNGVALRRRRRHSGTSATSSSMGASNATSLSQPDQHNHAPVARDASTHTQWRDPSETFPSDQSQPRDQRMPHERAGRAYRDNPASRSRGLSTAYFQVLWRCITRRDAGR